MFLPFLFQNPKPLLRYILNLQINDIDYEIIKLLKRNGRTPNTEIAKKLNLSEAAIRKRIKKLLDDEIIQVVAVDNPEKFGFEFRGNIKIKTDIKKNEDVKNELFKIDRICYISRMTGACDFDVDFSVKSQNELQIIIEKINKIDGVYKAEVSIRMQLLKNINDWGK